MTADEYVPSEAEMIAGLVQLPDEPAGLYRRVRPDEMKRGLARVRRDAAREAMHALRTHLAASRGYQLIGPDGLDYYIHSHHPEETP